MKISQTTGSVFLMAELLFRMSNVIHGVAMDVAIGATGTVSGGCFIYLLYLLHQAKKSRGQNTSTYQS
jgi:hypothetical protein